MNVGAIVALLTQLLALVPQGTMIWTMLNAQQTALGAVFAKGADYVPTADDWAGVDAAVAADLGISDQQAAAARAHLGG